MTHHFLDPGTEAELAYRREVLQSIGRSAHTRRGTWLRRRRRAR